jgi:hypothetical protein
MKYRKTVAPLIIGYTEPEQANYLIDNGLYYEQRLLNIELFDGRCQITQCYKCYSYGHVAKHCNSVERYGFYVATGHKPSECSKKEDNTKYRCINCKKHNNHLPWDRECPVWKQ